MNYYHHNNNNDKNNDVKVKVVKNGCKKLGGYNHPEKRFESLLKIIIIPAKNPNSKVNNQMCVARSYEFHKGPI